MNTLIIKDGGDGAGPPGPPRSPGSPGPPSPFHLGIPLGPLGPPAAAAATTSQEKYVDFLENKLNKDIGWFYWKKYIAAAFWSQISMPINLAITLMTAVTTAQASAPDLIPIAIYKNLTYASLILTVLNTFFRPHEKLQRNLEYLKSWTEMGIAFEKVYYSSKNNNYDSDKNSTTGSIEASSQEYVKLQDSVNELRQREGPDMMNFLTDFVHVVCHYTCIRRNRNWLDRG